MTIESRHAGVTLVLQVLSKELDPIIQQRLLPHLNGLPWTAVLSELDRRSGRLGRTYDRSDLQCQLRMLTERLGAWGFPFDNRDRRVSLAAGELRLVRNRWAHMDDFDSLDQWRAADTARRLVEHLEIPSAELRRIADEALMRLIRENVGPQASLSPVREPRGPLSDTPRTDEDELITPQPEALVDPGATTNDLTGPERARWVPWTIEVQAEEFGVIEDLPKKLAKMKVRATAREIVDMEGPVSISRVATLVARTYGVARLGEKRRRQIERQVRQSVDHVDSDGFLWPTGVNPETWTGFRPNDSLADRDLTEICPAELRNAAAVVGQGMKGEEMMRAVLQTFGRSRLTSRYRKHLTAALEI
ncbi:DUF3320 domain-containing protein [Schaalia sp. 19OD2882]|uniref:DUF3320 domain-containing protein n=1 Tax=Schaalia sp. 19OD2882 TaxID=2794089 RepID=UPI001C1E94AC|nr:DUF3320 domain-containing protein [Schaalia sp. 19OD2882]QWW19146.1 DUF3320 domain-containing protein [Schaalia sp. 19OD2882]